MSLLRIRKLTEGDSNLELAKDIVILFLACVAIIVGLCLTSYLSAMLFEKYNELWERYRQRHRRRGGSFNFATGLEDGDAVPWVRVRPLPNSTTTTTTTTNALPSLTIQAGLVGITKKERHLILEYFFSKTTPVQIYNRYDNARDGEEPVEQPHDNQNEGNGNLAGLELPSFVSSSSVELSQGAGPSSSPSHSTTTTTSSTSANDGSKITELPNSPPAHGVVEDLERPVELSHNHLEQQQSRDGVCSICLSEYVSGDKILTGTTCQHQFHYECAMQWLYKDHQYDCPYCRKEMLTVTELQDAAQAILGEERSNELWQLNTTTTMTASTPDGGGGGGSHAHQVRRTASATVATTSMTPASA